MKTTSEARFRLLTNAEELTALKQARTKVSPLGLTDDESNLADWLGRLKLLHGVPFNYLVPDESMLPVESIRFFYCDTIWLDYLLEGAMSPGRSTSADQAGDSAFLGALHTLAASGSKSQRKKIFGHLANHMTDAERLKTEGAVIQSTEKVTGFLLRSGVVAGWPGLIVDAVSKDGKPCQILRMEQLSPSVLLCLFQGVASKVTFHETPDVLHFGVSLSVVDEQVSYSKSFRYVVDVTGHAAGSAVANDVARSLDVSAKMRPGNTRVIRVNDMAKTMRDTLEKKIHYEGPFTSAQFALQMLEGVQAVDFNVGLTPTEK